MPRYEYKVVPAPKKPGKIKGVKGTEAKFAAELSRLMNEMGAEGWDYQRTDTLPCEERQGLTRRTTVFQTMLIFRRETAAGASESQRPAPALADMRPAPIPADTPAPRLRAVPSDAAEEGNSPKLGAPGGDQAAR